MGFERVAGPSKLLVSGVPSMSAALVEFESIAFHERVLLPFYERHLRDAPAAGKRTMKSGARVQFAVRGTNENACRNGVGRRPPYDTPNGS